MEKMETHELPTPRSDDVTPVQSTHSRPSFQAGLARVIDRERPSYRQLAEKVAADEQLQLAMKTRSDPLQTSPLMIDAGVQSDHAVDLLAVRQCSKEAREETETETETVTVLEKVDKSTAIDDDWLMATEADYVVAEPADEVGLAIDNARMDITSSPSELRDKNTEEQREKEAIDDDWLMATETEDVVAEPADEVELAIPDNAGTDITSSPSELHDKNTEEQKEKEDKDEEDDHKITISSSSASSEIGQRQHKVHWGAISVEEFKLDTPSPTETRSKNYADELLLPAPWVSQASVTQLGSCELKRYKALLVRSDEHMVIMETEEQSSDQPAVIADQSPCDRVNTEGLLIIIVIIIIIIIKFCNKNCHTQLAKYTNEQ